MVYDKAKFPARLREIMEEYGLNTHSMAARLHLSPPSISRYLNGKLDPKRTTVEMIAQTFNISPLWLLGANDEKYGLLYAPQEIKYLPLLGKIACGVPILATQNIDSHVATDAEDKATFCLTARGNSMIGARIMDGDILFVREQDTVENGDIAAVLIEESGEYEATVKRFYRYGNTVVLRPENPEYEEMTFMKSDINRLRIIGKVLSFKSEVI